MTRKTPRVQPSGSGRCPTCGAPTVRATRPFCSPRCRDLDLSRWLDGDYSIPVVELNDGERLRPRDEDER
ncbi:MAG: DNA gyrase inhibitor YacG [Geminicoccaceae bacterium]